ncbi:MAG: restriction endonuclease subunit S [Muribaculaceae bacterium]|nr:restriction endonuclease subunit S [Muribaculaceae bacterium]
MKEKLGKYISENSTRDKGRGYPVFSVTNSKGFCQEFFGKKVASENTSNYKVVPRGCFAYNPSRINVGSVACQDKEDFVSVSPIYVIFKVSSNINQNYLMYYLKSDYCMTYINAYSRGAVRNNLKLSQLGEFEINVPPLAEQERIVAELDLISSIIDKKKAQLKEYDQLAQSIFYSMFGDPITNEKGWEVKKLGLISTIGTGATPSREQEELYYGGDIHWVKTTEVHNCEITDTEETITQLAIDQTNCKIYPPNTLLMAMYGQGKTRGQIAKLKIKAATNQACAAIMLDETICDLDFIYEQLFIKYDNIRAMAQGGNQANLNMKLVGSIPIILPSLPLQQQFASKVKVIEKQKSLIRQSIKETETLFNSRMDYYFN